MICYIERSFSANLALALEYCTLMVPSRAPV